MNSDEISKIKKIILDSFMFNKESVLCEQRSDGSDITTNQLRLRMNSLEFVILKVIDYRVEIASITSRASKYKTSYSIIINKMWDLEKYIYTTTFPIDEEYWEELLKAKKYDSSDLMDDIASLEIDIRDSKIISVIG